MNLFAAWLNMQYLDWQKQSGRRASMREFSAWLGINYPTVNQWANGKAMPRIEFIEQLAQRLGIEVYAVLGMPTPDPILLDIKAHWSDLSRADKAQIKRILKRHQ